MFDVYQDANVRLGTWLGGVAYLGPLRSLPQSTYRLAAEQPSDVGREGQHTPEILFRGRETELREFADGWLRRLGYGQLDFEELGEEYFRVFIVNDLGLKVNIAHSGVGLSQLLPLMVQGFAIPDECLMIAQQPEIHLNPAQQCLLTDFFIELAQNHRRVLVETHSEHVLLRLRRRIAEGDIPASEVGVYYFDSNRSGITVERIDMDERGGIHREDWPTGFFEEQLTDSFALALAQSRGGSGDV
jgi:predicted ATPase